jgi:hypothetical protein
VIEQRTLQLRLVEPRSLELRADERRALELGALLGIRVTRLIQAIN